MAHLTKEQQNKYFMKGFNDQLEKRAAMEKIAVWEKIIPKAFHAMKTLFTKPGSTNIGKWAIGLKNAKGARLNYLSQWARPTNLITSNQIKGTQAFTASKYTTEAKGLSRGIRASVGNAAQNLQAMGTGARGQGILKGTNQFIKNLGTFSSNQLRAARYKEIPLTHKGIIGDIDKGYDVLKGKKLFSWNGKKYGFSDRKIRTLPGGEFGLVKKRPISQLFGASFTAPGLLATGVAFGGKDEKGNKVSVPKRVLKSVPDAVSWGIAPAIGGTILGYQGAKGLYNFMNKKKKQNNLVA